MGHGGFILPLLENKLWSICGLRAGLPYLLWRSDCGVFVDLVRASDKCPH